MPVNLFDVIGESTEIDMDRFSKSYSSEDFTEIGMGTMDIQKIIDVANSIGSVEYIILEQDFSKYGQIESIRISMEAFRKFSGISWN